MAGDQSGNFPEWELGLQLFDEKFADKFAFDVLDATKLIPEEVFRSEKSGGWCSIAASTISSPRPNRSHFVRRISCPASTSAMTRCCRAAIFPISIPSSNGWAAPILRILPINAPKCPFRTFQQDGHMAMVNPARPREL